MTLLPTILAYRLANRCRFGDRKGGFAPTIRAAGFNGIVAIIWAVASMEKMHGRLNDGGRCAATFVKFRRTVTPETFIAVAGSGKRFYNGLTIAEKSNVTVGSKGMTAAVYLL